MFQLAIVIDFNDILGIYLIAEGTLKCLNHKDGKLRKEKDIVNLKELRMSKEIDEYTFGKYVRERREALGKSVRGFAEELGMTAAYLSDIEKGNRYAPKKYLEKLMEKFDIPEEDKGTFEDLASATRGYTYEDINPILGGQPLAREALRKFKETNIPEEKCDELWITFMREFDRIAEEQLQYTGEDE